MSLWLKEIGKGKGIKRQKGILAQLFMKIKKNRRKWR